MKARLLPRMILAVTFALSLFAFAVAGDAGAWEAQEARPGDEDTAAAASRPVSPDRLMRLSELNSYRYSFSKQSSGAAGERMRAGLARGNFPAGLIPAGAISASGSFVLEISGAYVAPDRSFDKMVVGDKAYSEWFIGSQMVTRLNDGPVEKATARKGSSKSYAMHYWDATMAPWLEENSDLLVCGAKPETVNSVKAYKCTAPLLTPALKVALMDTAGIFTEATTKSVSNLSFELWLTEENAPVRLRLAGSGVDVRGRAFRGSYSLDLMDINSKSLRIETPR